MTNVTSAVSVSTSSVTTTRSSTTVNSDRKLKGQLVFESSLRHPADREDFEATGNETYVPGKGKKSYNNQYDGDLNISAKASNTSPKQSGKREEGWREVVRKGQSDDSGRFMNSPFRSKKVSVPPNAISRVIGRGGSNINAIRVATGAHIEVEKQSKCQVERIITIKGSTEATRQAHSLITLLIKDPEADITLVLPKSKLNVVTTSSWDKSVSTVAASKTKIGGSVNKPPNLTSSTTSSQVNKSGYSSGASINPLVPVRSSSSVKLASAFPTSLPRATAPRLMAAAEKRAQAVAAQMASSSNTKTTMSYTSAIMTAGRAGTKIVTTSTTQTFAAKLSEITASTHSSTTVMQSTHTVPVNKQQKPMAQAAQTVTIMSATSAATAHTTSQQQSVVSTSPKHCRSLPILSAPSAIASHYPGKSSFSPGTIAISSSSATNAVVTMNCPESSINSTSAASSVRVTPSPPIVSSLQMQTLPPPPPTGQQQQQPMQQQQSQQGIRSATPVVTQEHQQQPQQQQQQQQQQPSSTPLEYSLFNDTFTKVAQQSMWGGRENETQKGMNFATVAGGGVSSNTNSGSSTAKFDSSPPQVDASKAPGYRGTTMCSPVSSKPGSTSNVSTNVIGNVVTGSVHSNPMQSAQFQSSTSYSEHPLPNKPPGSLAVARPVIPQQNIDIGTSMAAQFNRPAVFQGDLTTRNTTTHQPATHVIPSTSQPALDVNLFKAANSGGGSYEHPNVNSSLLKMMPNDSQSGAGHSLLPFHPHMQSFAQTIAPSVSVSNTPVNESRLNPRAPDFSSSLHLSNKPQVMFNAAAAAAAGPAGMHPANMFAAPVPAPPPSAIQSNNLAMLGNYPLGKYQAPSRATPAANTGISTTVQTTRWPFATPTPHASYRPHQDPMISQMGFSNQLANIGGQPGGSIDLITSLENGGSPAISPSSPAQVAQEMSQLKIEDRKVPRPIGTERAKIWKNYSSTGLGPGGDADSMGWMINEKLAWSNCNLAPGLDRHQMFRSNPTYNQRIPNVEPELHQMMDSTFQGHVNAQQPFPTNGNTPLSLMPLALIPGQYGASDMQEIQPNEQNKIDPPAWGMSDTVQDKQHPAWTPKWTH